MMRTSPEQYGAYIGEIIEEVDQKERPHYTSKDFRKIGRGAMNCHHLLWMGKTHKHWIRDVKDFQPQMDIQAHRALHEECLPVPEFSRQILQIVRADFTPTGNTLDSLDKLLLSIDHASTMEQVHPIDRQLAQLSIHALEMQIPYLRGNISKHYCKTEADRNYEAYIRGYM